MQKVGETLVSLDKMDQMGEAKRRQSATQRFIEQFPECCFCGGMRRSTTREHMPPKSLFDRSYRPDKLVMPACNECNKGTSTADLAVSLASRWSHETSPQAQLDHARLAARIRKQAPELVAEWTSLPPDERPQARLQLAKQGVAVPEGASLAVVGPYTIQQFNLFAHKVVLALYFEHFRAPLRNAGCLCASWRTKEDFARDGVPSIFFEMLPDYGTLVQGRWNEQQTFEYRHASNRKEGVFGCLARFRRGFFVYGFAVAEATEAPNSDMDWVKPADLLSLVKSQRFLKKL